MTSLKSALLPAMTLYGWPGWKLDLLRELARLFLVPDKLNGDVLRALQFIHITGCLTEEEVAVPGSPLRGSCVKRVSLLKDLLRGSPLLNEASEG